MKQFIKFGLSMFIKIVLKLKKKVRYKYPKSILLMHLKPLGIGDYLMTTPSYRALRKHYPDTKITMLTDREFIKNYIDRLFDKVILYKSIFDLKNLPKYDLIILPNKNLIQSLIALLFLKKVNLIGYIDSYVVKANFPLNSKTEYTKNMHYYDMGRAVMSHIIPDFNDFTIEPLIKKRLFKKKTERKIIAINPFVLWKSRTWPINNYKELIEKLVQDGYLVIIIGDKNEMKYNSQLNNNKIINLTGKYDIEDLCCLIRCVDLLITGDSGTLHLAISENVTTLSLWGCTNPLLRLPHNKINKTQFFIQHAENPEANNYNLEYEPKSRAINAITVEEVYNKVKKICPIEQN